ncbi:MAG: quinolinate synthase NadA [Candidatus Ratteibacteria bacterium]|nr:quinolinate synthase NadA [Candidatus Ratteibacteria bacterium]
MDSIVQKINDLKKKRNAVILVHNYQLPEIQDIADFLGDSLGLSQKAAETNAKVIVFCGVHFMAQTASILCPDKIVLMPDVNAGCPMANMINAEDVRQLKKEQQDTLVVAYVNTTAEVKAESDVCCTSANAVKIVNSLPAEKIIFIPDKYLGQYVASQSQKEIIFWEGYCPVHAGILASDMLRAKREHPKAEALVHPECTPDVIALADKVFSTTGMCNYAKKTKSKEIIVGTETGIIYRLQKENPDKKFYPASKRAICEDMKKNNLEKVLWSLENLKHEVKVEEKIRRKAKKAIDKMLEFSRVD